MQNLFRNSLPTNDTLRNFVQLPIGIVNRYNTSSEVLLEHNARVVKIIFDILAEIKNKYHPLLTDLSPINSSVQFYQILVYFLTLSKQVSKKVYPEDDF